MNCHSVPVHSQLLLCELFSAVIEVASADTFNLILLSFNFLKDSAQTKLKAEINLGIAFCLYTLLLIPDPSGHRLGGFWFFNTFTVKAGSA